MPQATPATAARPQILIASLTIAATLFAALEAILRAAGAPPGALQALRRDRIALCQTLSDAGHGRWVKLLSVRTDIHARLKLYEFKQLLRASEGLVGAIERAGCRPVPALASTLQARPCSHQALCHFFC